ncbi:endospore germination permease [Cohnella sp.]|uniref:GerAB/ArcD/ProY family transporter n=1 Tax=Cohnella sp. TaxID=1883426 RepID=UPI0035656D60
MPLNPEKIGSIQAAVLISMAITPTAAIVIPTVSIGASGQDAWLSVLAAWPLGIGFALLYGSLSRMNPGVSFFSWLDSRLGRAVSVIAGLLLAQYYLSVASVTIRELVNFLSNELLQKTPVAVLSAVPILIAVYAASGGIEVIARISALVYVGMIMFLALGIGLELNQMQPQFLFPIGDAPLPRLVESGLPSVGWLSEASLLFILAPYLSKPRRSTAIAIAGVSLAAVQLSLIVLLVLLQFGPELPGIMAYPAFAAAEIIKYGSFVERVDLIFICVWVATVYVKLCIFVFGTVHCFTHSLRIKAAKPFLWTISLLIFLHSLYSWSDEATFLHYQKSVSTAFLITCNVIVPALLWLGLKIKRRPPASAGESP